MRTGGAAFDSVGGDFFASVPDGCDTYVLKHIVHDWDDERAIALLANIAKVLPENGRVLVVEQVLPPPNVPGLAKIIDLEMLVVTPGGRERSEAEYRALFTKAGLRCIRALPTMGPLQIVEGGRA